jgi:hypothetical protein
MAVPQKDIKDGIIISAKLIRETAAAYYLDCEGDKEWFSKSLVNFDAQKEELEAPKWLLKQKFPETKF